MKTLRILLTIGGYMVGGAILAGGIGGILAHAAPARPARSYESGGYGGGSEVLILSFAGAALGAITGAVVVIRGRKSGRSTTFRCGKCGESASGTPVQCPKCGWPAAL
jgi:predicted RNA-binding Zn-ribbon protein involved in translation (DUF1610 family)